MSSSFLTKLSAIVGLTTIEEGLSEERIRNSQGKAQLAQLEVSLQEEATQNTRIIEAQEKLVEAKQAAYTAEVEPLLSQFDELSAAEHFYDTSSRIVENEMYLTDMILNKEVENYGYLGKKLASLSLHFEYLRQEITSGKPFHLALQGLLKDAEDKDLEVMAGPLQNFAMRGTPSDFNVRHAAFMLSQTMTKAGSSISEEKNMNKWLAMLRFHTTLSPAKEEANYAQARKDAKRLMGYVRNKEYGKSLEIVENGRKQLEERNDPVLAEFNDMEAAYRREVIPVMTADLFLTYGSCWLNCRRFANVEKVIS